MTVSLDSNQACTAARLLADKDQPFRTNRLFSRFGKKGESTQEVTAFAKTFRDQLLIPEFRNGQAAQLMYVEQVAMDSAHLIFLLRYHLL